METVTTKMDDVHNEGLIDRGLRIFVAALLLGGPIYQLEVMDANFTALHGFLILASLYPALTGILGWDPFYGLTKVKSCGFTGRNQCGTLPYEVVTTLGGHLKPDNDYDHSLAGSHR